MPASNRNHTERGVRPDSEHRGQPELNPDWHYHFLGIGGIGMSGLAEVMHRRGFRVSGSDIRDDGSLSRLRELGIQIHIGHEKTALEGVQAVVYTPALPGNHPIWDEVARRHLPHYHRAELLGAITRTRRTLAVTGTHGKTTSTACLAHVLSGAGWDPTALVGGHVPQFGGSNVLLGNPPWLVIEADESDGSFTHFSPQAILLTNVEAEHMDHHGSMEAMEASFREFLGMLPSDGLLAYCADDPRAGALAREVSRSKVSYGLAGSGGAEIDVTVHAETAAPRGMRLTFILEGAPYRVDTPLAGRHNALNLAGVFALADGIGVPVEAIVSGLAGFRGVARRQQYLGTFRDCRIFDDYAHHPTEVRATLDMFLEQYGEPVTVVFQPHLYSRTAHFAAEFAEALRVATSIYVTDIYGAREKPVAGVSSKLILERLADHPRAYHLPDWRDPGALGTEQGGVLVSMGAGDITGLGPLLLSLERAP